MKMVTIGRGSIPLLRGNGHEAVRGSKRVTTPTVTFGATSVKQGAQICDLLHIAYAVTAKREV